MGIVNTIFGRRTKKETYTRDEVDEKIMAAIKDIPYYMGTERKFDVRDINSFSDTQREILMTQVLESSSYFSKVWIYNVCVRKIALTVAKISRYNYLENSKGDQIEDNKIFNMLNGRCNPVSNGFEQIESLVSFYIMNGNAYEQVIGTPILPIEIWSLLADRIEPKTDSWDELDKIIKYYLDRQTEKHIEPEEIIHYKAFNPNSYIRGMPWLQAAASRLDTLADTEDFNASVLKNGVFPSINWHTEQNLSETQVDALEKHIDRRQSGPGNAGKSLITWSGIRAEKMAFSPEEMQLLENERYNAAVIAISMHVPPEILGPLTDKQTYNNVKEAKADFIDGTCLPILEKINSNRSSYFWPNGEFKIKIDIDKIDSFKSTADELSKSWWLTPDQKLKRQGHTPTGLPEMEKRYIPMGYVDLKDLEEKEDTGHL